MTDNIKPIVLGLFTAALLYTLGVHLALIVWPPVIPCTPISAAIPIPIPTATPWVKKDVLIIMMPAGFQVWTDNAEEDRLIIDTVKGVVDTKTYGDGHMIYVRLDPRYDKNLVAADVMGQLTKNREQTK